MTDTTRATSPYDVPFGQTFSALEHTAIEHLISHVLAGTERSLSTDMRSAVIVLAAHAHSPSAIAEWTGLDRTLIISILFSHVASSMQTIIQHNIGLATS